MLDTVSLGALSHGRADTLSGGQRQRVGIARAMMQSPQLLLADEPTSRWTENFGRNHDADAILAESHGFPVIANIYNVALARRFADRIVDMARGGVVFDGQPEALSDEILQSIYGGEGWLE